MTNSFLEEIAKSFLKVKIKMLRRGLGLEGKEKKRGLLNYKKLALLDGKVYKRKIFLGVTKAFKIS